MSPRVKLYLQLLDACDLAWDQLTDGEQVELRGLVAKVPATAAGGPLCGNCGHRTNGLAACGFCGSGTGIAPEKQGPTDTGPATTERFRLLELK